jgi:ribosomal protein S18 acetylase RimI-like enzyme
MKVKIRSSQASDLDQIFELHKLCFSPGDHWYKQFISQQLGSGIVVEGSKNNTLIIIGVLFQGDIVATEIKENFEPNTDAGKLFLQEEYYSKPIYGITMVCIHPSYRKKGLARKLIEKHHNTNKNKLLCLNVRKSNENAVNLYKKMGYEQSATIKEQYYHPTEDSLFMIKNN